MKPGGSKNQLKIISSESWGDSGDLLEASCVQDHEEFIPEMILSMFLRHLVDFAGATADTSARWQWEESTLKNDTGSI